MKKFLENVCIVLSSIIVIALMLSGSYVFAQNKTTIEEKSYYVESDSRDGYMEHDLELSTTLTKSYESVKNSYEYDLSIVNGNVISTSTTTGKKEAIYAKGDAKYIGEVNYYYYDAKYIVVLTEDGDLYVNLYKSNQNNIKFKKVNTKNKIKSLRISEKKQRFYEYPAVQLYGVSESGDMEKILF